MTVSSRFSLVRRQLSVSNVRRCMGSTNGRNRRGKQKTPKVVKTSTEESNNNETCSSTTTPKPVGETTPPAQSRSVIPSQLEASLKGSKKKDRFKSSKYAAPHLPILTPGDSSKFSSYAPYYYYQRHNSSGSFRLTSKLPTVDASALLDKRNYIRRSAIPGGITTRSGTEAARRLLRGKKAFLEVMRDEVLSKSPRGAPPKSFTLAGHGVPDQLLQAHIDLASSILSYHGNVRACLLNNFGHNRNSTSVIDGLTVVEFRSRDGRTFEPWPLPKSSDDLELQMNLYLTVMNRLTCTLGTVLRMDPPPPPPLMDTNDDFVEMPASSYPLLPSYWRAEFQRAKAYPDVLLSKLEGKEKLIQPIVEWIPQEGKMGHVCVYLQGIPSDVQVETSLSKRRKRPAPVTMVFDAAFQETLR